MKRWKQREREPHCGAARIALFGRADTAQVRRALFVVQRGVNRRPARGRPPDAAGRPETRTSYDGR